MGWKFWEREKSEAEKSLERLQSGVPATAPSADAGPGGTTGDPMFRMTVEDVFTITGRGTVAIGRVESGAVAVDTQVRLSKAGEGGRWVTVTGIEMFRKVVDTAHVGDNVGLLLREVTKADVDRGDVLLGS